MLRRACPQHLRHRAYCRLVRAARAQGADDRDREREAEKGLVFAGRAFALGASPGNRKTSLSSGPRQSSTRASTYRETFLAITVRTPRSEASLAGALAQRLPAAAFQGSCDLGGHLHRHADGSERALARLVFVPGAWRRCDPCYQTERTSRPDSVYRRC